MTRFDGSTALKLDFDGVTGVAGMTSMTGMTTTGTMAMAPGRGRAGLRLASPGGALRGPDKYKILEHRRRQAQIRARHLLELMEEAR